jgi:hypothetical protein
VKIDWRTAFACAGALAFVGILVLLVRWGSHDRELPRPEHWVVASELTLQGFQRVGPRCSCRGERHAVEHGETAQEGPEGKAPRPSQLNARVRQTLRAGN